MMKKIFLIILCVFTLTSCSSTTSTSVSYQQESEAEIEARQLVSILNMNLDSMSKVKDRVVKGMVLNGDTNVSSDFCLYRSNEEGNYDTVGVFFTKDMETLKTYVEDYLSALKSEVNKNYPEEVFKISNAIIENNDDSLIFIISTDIETAKEQVKDILSEGEKE